MNALPPKKQLQLQSHCQEGRVKRGLRQKVKLQMFRHVIDVKVAIRCCWHDADGLWTNFKLRCPTCWSDGKQPTDGEQAHLLVQVTLYCAWSYWTFALFLSFHSDAPYQQASRTSEVGLSGLCPQNAAILVEDNLNWLQKDYRLWQEPQDCFEHVGACETTSWRKLSRHLLFKSKYTHPLILRH